jgi:acyl carrier protein
MTDAPPDRATLQQAVLDVLRHTAPEVSAASLDFARPLRDQVDIDSIDWLNFMIGLHERFAIDIPESDYARLATLDGVLAYVGVKLHSRSASGGKPAVGE